MSGRCGNCQCFDRNQCVKKGNADEVIEIEPNQFFPESMDMDVAAAGENDGKCKCGSSCTCTNCTCGGH